MNGMVKCTKMFAYEKGIVDQCSVLHLKDNEVLDALGDHVCYIDSDDFKNNFKVVRENE